MEFSWGEPKGPKQAVIETGSPRGQVTSNGIGRLPRSSSAADDGIAAAGKRPKTGGKSP